MGIIGETDCHGGRLPPGNDNYGGKAVGNHCRILYRQTNLYIDVTTLPTAVIARGSVLSAHPWQSVLPAYRLLATIDRTMRYRGIYWIEVDRDE